MRKLVTYLSLCLLLLGAQQSALLHELSHFAAVARAAAGPDAPRQEASPAASRGDAALDGRRYKPGADASRHEAVLDATRQRSDGGVQQPGATLSTQKALETTCALCLAYSQLANAATPTSLIFHFHETPNTVESTVVRPLLPLAAPIARSRGPPPQLNA